MGCINNVLRKRANFRKHPSDNRKIDALIEHLGENDSAVSAFLTAEKNLRKINEQSSCVIVRFQEAYSKLCEPNAEQHRFNFKNIRDNVRDRIPMPMSDRDAL